MICGDDVRRLPYAERSRRAALMIDALRRDADELSQANSIGVPPPVEDVWAAIDRKTARGPSAKPVDVAPAPSVTHDAPRRDCARVRMKQEYALHQMADAVNAGRARVEAGTGPVWPCRGLLLFPGHGNPPLPLDPPHEWKKEWSKSQQREYWYNVRTRQSIWSSDRKTRPTSFRSCAAALLRWDRRSNALPEVELIEVVAEQIPPPAATT